MRVGILAADAGYEATRMRAAAGLGAYQGGEGGPADEGDRLERGLARHGKTAAAAREALESRGHVTIPLTVDAGFLPRLLEARPDLVFNTYFGPARRGDQASVAAFMEYAGVSFSGGNAACHFIGLDKYLSKRLLAHAGLPTPQAFTTGASAETAKLLRASDLKFPLIVKAPGEGEGIGLDERSVVRSIERLVEAIERIIAGFGPPALIEEFMPGREFTVGVLDGAPPRVLPILEIDVEADSIFSYKAKAGDWIKETCPAPLPAAEAALLAELAIRAGRTIGCRDYWRVDFRADPQGRPRILEVNTLPGLEPGYSDLVKMIGPAGMSYGELAETILRSAAQRMAGAPETGCR